ncbi:MAG: hypothetical protein ACI8WB_001871 [Phenylobacterium sp.]|jgi:hypothetical protein
MTFGVSKENHAMKNSIDESKCPLCGEVNLCAMVAAEIAGKKAETCWCIGADFTPDIIAGVPEQAKGKSCICQRCVTKLALVKEV